MNIEVEGSIKLAGIETEKLLAFFVENGMSHRHLPSSMGPKHIVLPPLSSIASVCMTDSATVDLVLKEIMA